MGDRGLASPLAKLKLVSETLPEFYNPSNSMIVENFRRALFLTGLLKSNYWMIAFDGTVYRECFDLIFNLRADPIIVGGESHKDRRQDYATITCKNLEASSSEILELDPERLAKEVMTYGCKSIDRKSIIFDCCFRPRTKKKGVITKEYMVEETGEILQCAVAANGRPPRCIAYDAHGTHFTINRILVGIALLKSFTKVAFWQHLRYMPVPQLKFFPFQQPVVTIDKRDYNLNGFLRNGNRLPEYGFRGRGWICDRKFRAGNLKSARLKVSALTLP